MVSPVLTPTDRVIAYRIQFSSEVVKPQGLPQFAYVSTQLLFDSVVYTAIVRAPNAGDALAAIKECWPGAVFRSLEQGTSAFRAEDYYIRAVEYGSYLSKEHKSWWQRMRRGS